MDIKNWRVVLTTKGGTAVRVTLLVASWCWIQTTIWMSDTAGILGLAFIIFVMISTMTAVKHLLQVGWVYMSSHKVPLCGQFCTRCPVFQQTWSKLTTLCSCTVGTCPFFLLAAIQGRRGSLVANKKDVFLLFTQHRKVPNLLCRHASTQACSFFCLWDDGHLMAQAASV